MAYELAEYYGRGTEKQNAALAKARSVAAANRAAKKAPVPAAAAQPAKWYSIENPNEERRCRPFKSNEKRSKYSACRLKELHDVPCKYRSKENYKRLGAWAKENCPKKPRASPLMAQLKEEAKRVGVRISYIGKDGKRKNKTKAMLADEVLASQQYN